MHACVIVHFLCGLVFIAVTTALKKKSKGKIESPGFSSNFYTQHVQQLNFRSFSINFNNIKDTKAPHEILSSFVRI